MRRPSGLAVMAGLALAHCTLVGLGSAGIYLYRAGPVGEVLAYYSVLTGAERGFGFFAPSVTNQPRMHYEVTRADGQIDSGNIEDGLSSEAAIRVGHFESEIYSAMVPGQEDVRRSMAASVAGKVFARYPRARNVKVQLQVYELVSMIQYRTGQRPRWQTSYEADFSPPIGVAQ